MFKHFVTAAFSHNWRSCNQEGPVLAHSAAQTSLRSGALLKYGQVVTAAESWEGTGTLTSMSMPRCLLEAPGWAARK